MKYFSYDEFTPTLELSGGKIADFIKFCIGKIDEKKEKTMGWEEFEWITDSLARAIKELVEEEGIDVEGLDEKADELDLSAFGIKDPQMLYLDEGEVQRLRALLSEVLEITLKLK